MWADEKVNKLPSTRSTFSITSTKGNVFFVKPGKAFIYLKNQKRFNKVKSIASMSKKIDRVILSPCGRSSLHLFKDYPLLAYHENREEGKVVAFPLPKSSHERKNDQLPCALDAIAPNGKPILMTPSPEKLPTNPFANFLGKTVPKFSEHVQGFAISEDGSGIAIAIDNQFWVWQQYSENVLGVGFWTNLTSNQRFTINVHSNHPNTTYVNMKHHGFFRFKQSFTLHPVLAPNVPQNSAVSYQDLAVFNNPDEGIGVCCLTAVLPPCKPFDTLRLFISICRFRGSDPIFDRSELSLPVIEGYGGPCIWWSIDCRFAVIAVSQSLVIVTRHLRVIKVLPLDTVFPGDEPLVASVAWSCSGEYFIITSMKGTISAVSRDGKSLRHDLCALDPFTDYDDSFPVIAAADSKDPSYFIIYSDKKYRPLRMDMEVVPRNLEVLISLQFPQKSANDYYDLAVDEIQKNGVSDPYSLVKLLYLTDFFRIFPYQSPLRYLLLTLFEEGAKLSLESGNDIFTFFIIRCILRLTDYDVETYHLVMEMLSYSDKKRDKLLYSIIDDELNRRDYIKSPERSETNIRIYNPTDEDNESLIKATKPHHGRDVDLIPLIKFVKDVIYNNEMSDLHSIDCDMNLFLNILLKLGLFDRAMKLSNHRSITAEPAQIFARIAEMHSNDAAKLYRALVSCISASPEDEVELRAVCVKAIVNILKEQISNSVPTKGKFISSLVSLEEGVDLFVPESFEQLSDFAVILGIGFCAADYKNCQNFFNHKLNMIHEYLREAVHSLFSMLWFVQWRYLAITETARNGRANDATLRLLAFPDFVNTEKAMAQILDVPKTEFSHEIYSLYVGGSKVFEDDPYFPDFAGECSSKITPRTLSRLSSAVLQFGTDEECDIPYSGLLVSTIISHMIPWLRCGIPRALAGFKCEDDVPPELLNFEEFELPKVIPPKMEIDTHAITEVPPDDIPQKDHQSSSSLSYGESPISRPKRRKPRPEPSYDQSSFSSDYSTDRRRKHSKKKRSKPPVQKRPNPTRLLTVDPLSVAPNTSLPTNQNYYNQPQYPYPYQQPVNIPMFAYQQPDVLHNYQPPTQNAFAPIWDFNPADFKKEEPPTNDNNPPPYQPPTQLPPQTPPSTQKVETITSTSDIPKRTTTETQIDPPPQPRPVRPFVIVHSRQKSSENTDPFDISSTSELSDIEPIAPIKRELPVVNPFPLDDGLHKKVEMLLDEVRGIPDAPDLPEMPQFVPPPIYDVPIPKFNNLDEALDKHVQKATKTTTNININSTTNITNNNTNNNTPFSNEPFPNSNFRPNLQTMENSNNKYSYRPPLQTIEPDFRPPLHKVVRDSDDSSVRNQNDQWRPSIVPIKDSNILACQEIPVEQFMAARSQMPRTTLQEINQK
ncbi:hypothetical protein TRFO_04799 [Tritrichomonas foetus]|uniref:Uncharacterized protein n=1 Tax=Tritrichomonas foetus TaxID=1144522 RepID=A0A1J4KBW2_9EUKA|nr:hypothetical protein TRFO_04799 [Tritrichomonas foetus]|eukprot:OHT08715.1 hypothetical protein TRFO_04799 [Tritrichomonas foetus]